jgi:hypothetical protein
MGRVTIVEGPTAHGPTLTLGGPVSGAPGLLHLPEKETGSQKLKTLTCE